MFKSKKESNGKTEGKRSERGRGFYAAASLLVGLALIVFVAPRSAMADTLFSDLGSPVSYNESLGWTVSGSGSIGISVTDADLFTSAITGSVTQIDLGVTYLRKPYPFGASIWTENASDEPGTEVTGASWTGLTPTASSGSSTNSLVTISGISGVSLTAGTPYFLILAPTSVNDDSLNFSNDNAQGVNGLVLQSTDGGTTWSSYPGSPLGAFDILGTPAAPAPEASSLTLLGIVLLAFTGLVVSKKLHVAR